MSIFKHSGGGLTKVGAPRMWWLQPCWGEGGVVHTCAPTPKSLYEQEWSEV